MRARERERPWEVKGEMWIEGGMEGRRGKDREREGGTGVREEEGNRERETHTQRGRE